MKLRTKVGVSILAPLATLTLVVGCSTAQPETSEQPVHETMPEVTASQDPPLPPASVNLRERTGPNLQSCVNWSVCATDLGIPFALDHGRVGYLFGDTFAGATPGSNGWRSPVMLTSSTPAREPGKRFPVIEFDGAVAGGGEIMYNGHRTGGEFTVIPNDGLYIAETGDTYVSYMSIRNWDAENGASWQTNYAGLAVMRKGESKFSRIGPRWDNPGNKDPFQMVSLQRGDGDWADWVYALSVRAGRQDGPMMLQTVHRDDLMNKNGWHCWSGSNSWGKKCVPVNELLPDGTERPIVGKFGEPSLRKLDKGWVMSYLDLNEEGKQKIVTRVASQPSGPWSEPRVQLTNDDLRAPYGGFIHPASTFDDLVLMYSTWQRGANGRTTRYQSLQGTGTAW